MESVVSVFFGWVMYRRAKWAMPLVATENRSSELVPETGVPNGW